MLTKLRFVQSIIRHPIYGNSSNQLLNQDMASKTGLTKIRSDFLISVLGRLNSVAANLKGSDSFHEEKKFVLRDWVFLLIWTGVLILYLLLKLSLRKLERALIFSMMFSSSEVSLYLYKSTIWFYLVNYFHAWAGALNCYFDMLNQLQKQLSRTIVPTLAVSVELQVYC